jgi:HlyD family secretion protein
LLAVSAGLYLLMFPRPAEEMADQPSESGQIEINPRSEIVGATGTVTSDQSALLTWKTSGKVAEIYPRIGDQITAGEVLAVLDPASLSPADILAQAELIAAQKALQNLLDSKVVSARALQAVDSARVALDNALDPQIDQAASLQAIAQAEKDVADAERKLKILTAPVAQSAIDQAQANLVLAQKKLEDNQQLIDRIQKKLNKRDDQYKPWESRRRYKAILEGAELQRIQLQIAYENSLQKYKDLQTPPNATDVALADANLLEAQARLFEAQKAWDRITGGTSPADLALLEARLADAQREWQRVKDGPTEEDIAAAQARVAAAQATLEKASLIAPFNGTITEVISQPNDLVSPGSPAFRVDDLSSLSVEVGVSEIDINLVEIDQPVILTFDAILDKQYQGRVVEVSPVGSATQGIVDFKVRVELIDADSDVRPGMTAAVEISVQAVNEASLPSNRVAAETFIRFSN